MSADHISKWDNASKGFDIMNMGLERRYGRYKRELFSKCRGKVMLVAAGTGLDFQYFPEGVEVTAIDFSPKMVEKAREKIGDFNGKLDVVQADVTNLEFPDESFDTVATSCTFCSVPDPVKGLKEIHRILKPDGQLLMFEHVRPTAMLLGVMMDIVSPIVSKAGPELNRDTGANVKKAGFRLTREFNIYLDMMKLYEAVKA